RPRRGWPPPLANLLLAARDRLAPPGLLARQRDVPPGHARRGPFAIAERKAHVISGREMGSVLSPRLPFFTRCAPGGRDQDASQQQQPQPVASHVRDPPRESDDCGPHATSKSGDVDSLIHSGPAWPG